jgi:hypothetical protein
MELFKYYNIDECLNTKNVFEKLDAFKKDGKITYNKEGELLKIEDIDLEEKDIKILEKLFDDNDVYPYLDLEIGDDDDDDFDFDDEDENDDY